MFTHKLPGNWTCFFPRSKNSETSEKIGTEFLPDVKLRRKDFDTNLFEEWEKKGLCRLTIMILELDPESFRWYYKDRLFYRTCCEIPGLQNTERFMWPRSGDYFKVATLPFLIVGGLINREVRSSPEISNFGRMVINWSR